MRLASLAPLLLAVVLGAGCGARTGEDELLTADLTGVGGQASGGGPGSGATGGVFTGGASSSGGGPGACCQVSGGKGCVDKEIQACVCAQDDFCCQGAWDAKCVGEVEEFGCGACSFGSGGAGGSGGSSGQCCSVQAEPGCVDAAVERCVCDSDSFCCDVAWDATCVGQVPLCGSSCNAGSGGASPGDCCAAHSGPGCNVPEVESCVCAQDEYCCKTDWDAICVTGAEACNSDCSSGGSGGSGGGGGGPSGGGVPGSGGTGGVPGTGGFPASGGFGGVGASGGFGGIGGAGGMGGNPYCSYFPGQCESCVCNSCYDPLVGCYGDYGCYCLLYTGCTGFDCLAECGTVATLASVALFQDLATCQQGSGCPCP